MEPRAAIAQLECQCVCNIYCLNAKILAHAHQLANKLASRTNTNTRIYRIFQNDLLSLHAGRQKHLQCRKQLSIIVQHRYVDIIDHVDRLPCIPRLIALHVEAQRHHHGFTRQINISNMQNVLKVQLLFHLVCRTVYFNRQIITY